MFFSNYEEFFLILLFTLVYNAFRWWLPAFNQLRSALLLVGSFLLISLLLNFHTIFILSALMLGCYGVGRVLLNQGIQKSEKKDLLMGALAVLIFLFSVRNYVWIGKVLNKFELKAVVDSISIVGRLGLSYILFRLLHFLVDCYRGKIYGLGLLTFMNYIFFFPTYMSGPIDRYNNFRFWLHSHRQKVAVDMIFQGVGKLFVGAVKKLILVPFLFYYTNDAVAFDFVTDSLALQILGTVLAYSFYIYFDFSGYSDIAIGSAYLLGIRTPENFRNPYLSSNIAEFWKKWHISFSSILTEYIFKPFVIGLSGKAIMLPRMFVSVSGYLYTFTICGLWHGNTMNYIYWGLWHGIGLSVYKLWEQRFPRHLTLGWKSRIRNLTGITITFVFVTLGWFFFMSSTQKVQNLASVAITGKNSQYVYGGPLAVSANAFEYENYGWGIRLHYLSDSNASFEIEYRLIDSPEWVSVTRNRPGQYDFYDIHGEVDFNDVERNLNPGLYEVRIRKTNTETWSGAMVAIKNYKR